MLRPFSNLLLALVLLAGLTGCATVKRLTPDFSKLRLPKLSMPELPKFTALKKAVRLLPGVPDADQAAEADPQMPFNARGTLGYGHTLRLEVFEGSRSPKRVYRGKVVVDAKGVVDFGEIGSAKVGGGQLPEAVDAIAATFRLGLHASRPVTVHVLSVEEVPLVAVTGDVRQPEFLPAWEDMSLRQAVEVAGGRKAGSTARSLYLVREGRKRYLPSLEAADAVEPEAGDIIELSPDL